MQTGLHFPTRGGARNGAGRPAGSARPIRHDPRLRVSKYKPIHVTCRVLPGVGRLRTAEVYAAIRGATTVVARHDDVRIVHMSIQRTHIHLLLEATSGAALTRGMCSFLISAARGIHRALRMSGRVFERYHARSLRSKREVRNCLAYVLNNWRHHHEDRGSTAAVDRFSSAVAFDGWKELGDGGVFSRVPVDYAPLTVWKPRQWLLTTGWRDYGLISVLEIPGERRRAGRRLGSGQPAA